MWRRCGSPRTRGKYLSTEKYRIRYGVDRNAQHSEPPDPWEDDIADSKCGHIPSNRADPYTTLDLTLCTLSLAGDAVCQRNFRDLLTTCVHVLETPFV
jgi:hypothetical protein